MKYLCLLLSPLFLITACTNSTSNKQIANAPQPKIDKQDKPEQASFTGGCFRRITGRDTLLLQLNIDATKVSGQMKFDNYEKDSSHGTVEGTIEGDVIYVWYSFFSEGMKSVVQHAFTVTDNGLKMGTSEPEFKNDSSFIKQKNHIDFNSTDPLLKVNCNDIVAQLAK